MIVARAPWADHQSEGPKEYWADRLQAEGRAKYVYKVRHAPPGGFRPGATFLYREMEDMLAAGVIEPGTILQRRIPQTNGNLRYFVVSCPNLAEWMRASNAGEPLPRCELVSLPADGFRGIMRRVSLRYRMAEQKAIAEGGANVR